MINRYRVVAGLWCAAGTVLVRPVHAQCPDGSPPPCARAVTRAPAPPLDPNRIAILPFRVTAADTMLGEGVAELLASEFSGERGPRAVHMGTVIRAWRQSGGSARVPLAQDVAVRAARQMGAGYLVDGSIVGIGTRLTVTASVVSVADGRARRAEAVRGSADSLDVLLRRLTTTVMALAGGESREGARGVLTGSPAAMRAYLEGMAAWRRFRTDDASAAFERALREDSTFARATFMRYWTATWSFEPSSAAWGRRTFALRDRLSASDRLLLVALQGEHYPEPRRPAVSYADRVRAAQLLPESPEAQYLAGDWLFHYGSAVSVADALERSRDYFARSLALDSQETVMSHLLDAAVILADTPVVRALAPAFAARVSGHATYSWLAAGYVNDRALLARLRAGARDSGFVQSTSLEALGLLPAPVLEEVVTLIDANGQGARFLFAAMRGRPAAARAALQAGPSPAPGQDAFVAALTMAGDLDSTSGAEAVARLERVATRGAGDPNAACGVELWRAWWGVGSIWPDSVTLGGEALSCGMLINLLRAQRAGASDFSARLAAADSVLRGRLGPGRYFALENQVLARAWEAEGNPVRALQAIRLRPNGLFGVAGRGRSLREEGRLALATGDTTGAVRAWRLYLGYRQDAEPALHAERDSVRAALAALERRTP